jgi:TorA maturation chaperone TorD
MPDYDLDLGIARENLCRLLAACYYEPGPEFAEEKVFESMLVAATRIDAQLAALARQLGADYATEGAGALLLDYTRLFLGPNHIAAKPYGSIWLEGQNTVMGESTMAVKKLYEESGFDMSDDFHEVPDHIAVELEFLYLLIYRENEAGRNKDAEALKERVALRTRFLEQHLGGWIAPFSAAMIAGAQCNFYRRLAQLTASFVNMEAGNGRAN